MGFLIFVLFVCVLALFLALRATRREQRATFARLQVVEQWVATTLVPAATPVAEPAPVTEPAPEPAPEPASEPAPMSAPPVRASSQIQRLLAEHALSIVGGVFVLVAAIFFVSYGIDQGWIGPATRIALAAVFGVVLALVGIRRASRLPESERVGRAIGSLHGVLAGVGIAVVFLAIIGAVRIEEVVSTAMGISLQLVTAAVSVAIARTWRSQDLAAFGLTVALAAPLLLNAAADGATIGLVSIALVGTVLVALLEQWPRLLVVAAIVTAPQLLSFAYSTELADSAAIAVVVVWWALLCVAGIACALRDPIAVPRSSVGVILAAPPVVVTGIAMILSDGWDREFGSASVLPLTLFALAQLAPGLLVWRTRVPRLTPLTVSLVGAAATTAALAIANGSDGGAVTAAWVAEAVALAVIYWRTRSRVSLAFAIAMSVAALAHAFVLIAPISVIDSHWDNSTQRLAQALLSLGAIMLGAIAASALLRRMTGTARSHADDVTLRTLELLAPATLWYAGVLTLGSLLSFSTASFAVGVWSVMAAATALAAAIRLDRRELVAAALAAVLAQVVALALDHHGSGRALWIYTPAALLAAWAAVQAHARHAGLAHDVRDARDAGVLVRPQLSWILWGAGIQAAFALIVLLDAVPTNNLRAWDGAPLLDLAWQSALALAAIVGVALAVLRIRPHPLAARVTSTTAAVTALYVVSVLVVAVFSARPGELQQVPQLALTLTWVAIAIGALVAGTGHRLREHRELRVSAYALLGLAAVKLVLVDTADFETPARVAAFLLTGLGLLGAAAIEQRMRTDDRR